MNIYVQIQSLKRSRFKKLQIAKKLNIDVKTVRKYYDMTEKGYVEYISLCSERSRAMTKYDYFLIAKLQEFPDVTSAQLYDWLREACSDFQPSYASVRLHISNKGFDGWADIFGDIILATAMLDRLTFRCQVIPLSGESYRLTHRSDLFT